MVIDFGINLIRKLLHLPKGILIVCHQTNNNISSQKCYLVFEQLKSGTQYIS